MAEKLATFRIDADTWQAFRDKADGDGTNASALLKGFVLQYLGADTGVATDTRLEAVEAAIAQLDNRLGKLSAA